MPFVKLDCGMLNSSIWVDYDARAVFITALLMAEPIELTEPMEAIKVGSLEPLGFTVKPGWYGVVRAAGPGIVGRCGIDREAGMAALCRLQEGDSESRSSDFEGRRMVRVDGGFIILNYDKYRQRDYSASERMKRYRDRSKSRGNTPAVTRNSDALLRENVTVTRHVTQAEGEVEEEAENTTPYSPPVPSPTAQEWNLTVPAAGEHEVEPELTEDELSYLQEKPVPEKKATPVDPAAEEFIEWFLALLRRTGANPPTLNDKHRADWADTYRKMVKLDKRDPDEIRRVCEFARKEEWWKERFLFPQTLRRKRAEDGMMWYDVFLSKMPKYIDPNGDNRAWVVRKSRWDGMSVEERLRTKA